ncbi:helix-turn-helix domain-containing protein [Sinomicrobium kalidii]|uniref:helix-turn-helix domain-containing protein n=1 Tax=Sinomicrobium kalidii TaxID=2900738 RepID=UPI001E2E1F7D|nr:helix-turn-helix domain-containing protein [Sinomicrobium kalidii]UGU15409.1 helix-turn-helix domain-containing protein [Sinomicrobium kalidii]
MPADIITTDDLREFKRELLEELRELLQNHPGRATKKWLRSSEVMELLQLSPGTLQNLRINGTLPYTKIGGLLYYDAEEIEKVMTKNRIHNKF